MSFSFDCEYGEVEFNDWGLYVHLYDNSFGRAISYKDLASSATDSCEYLSFKMESLVKHLIKHMVEWVKELPVYRYSPYGNSVDDTDPDWPPYPPEEFRHLLSCALLDMLNTPADINSTALPELLYSKN